MQVIELFHAGDLMDRCHRRSLLPKHEWLFPSSKRTAPETYEVVVGNGDRQRHPGALRIRQTALGRHRHHLRRQHDVQPGHLPVEHPLHYLLQSCDANFASDIWVSQGM